MKRQFERFRRDDSGQDLIEYSLLAGFIALVVLGAVASLGASVNALWVALADRFPEPN